MASENQQSQVHVAASQSRCPFCHDHVNVDEAHQVCGTCLARHHQDCWTQHGACSNCGHASSLVPATQPATPGPRESLELRSLNGSRVVSEMAGECLQYSWTESVLSSRELMLLSLFIAAVGGEMGAMAAGSAPGMIAAFGLAVTILILMLVRPKETPKAKLNLGPEGLSFFTPRRKELQTIAWRDLKGVSLIHEGVPEGAANPRVPLYNGLILQKGAKEIKVATSLNTIEAEWLKGEIQRAKDHFKGRVTAKKG